MNQEYAPQYSDSKEISTNLEMKKVYRNKTIEAFEAKIIENEFNVDAWLGLLSNVISLRDTEYTRSTFERFLEKNPTSIKQWRAYLEFEYELKNYEAVEKIFTKTLVQLKSVELWQFYLFYIMEKNKSLGGINKITSDQYKTVDQSFSYAISNIGIDRDSFQIWKMYIDFLSEAECSSPWEINKKNENIRNIYNQAIRIPIKEIENIWKDFDQFENSLNKLTAKKSLGDLSGTYMTARSTLRESQKYIDVIQTNQPPHGIPVPISWTEKEFNYLNAWKRYIKWESSNPQKLESEKELEHRIVHIYQQATLALRFYPEIWIQAAQYLWKIDQKINAIKTLNDGRQALPKSLSVGFQLAEFEEINSNHTSCHEIFQSLLKSTELDIQSKRKSYDDVISVIDGMISKIVDSDTNISSSKLQDQESLALVSDENMLTDLVSALGMEIDSDFFSGSSKGASADENKSQLLLHKRRKLEKLKQKIETESKDGLLVERGLHTQVWVAYLRFSMRTGGIDAARATFKSARTGPVENLTFHIFVASAMIEYHVTKNTTIAGRIFELGLKHFGSEPKFVLEYMNYLINTNDSNNSRALFERVITQKNADWSLLWNIFLNYEYQYGDLRSVYSLDTRCVNAFENESLVNRLISRYRFLDLNPMESSCFGSSKSRAGPGFFFGISGGTNTPSTLVGSDRYMESNLIGQDSNNNDDNADGRIKHGEISADREAAVMNAEEAAKVKLGSIRNRKFLTKDVLLSSILIDKSDSNVVKPNFSLWGTYKPVVINNPNAPWNNNTSFNPESGGANSGEYNDGNQNERENYQENKGFHEHSGRNDFQSGGDDHNLNQILSRGDVLSFLYLKVNKLPNNLIPTLDTDALLTAVVNNPNIRNPQTESELIPSVMKSGLRNTHGSGQNIQHNAGMNQLPGNQGYPGSSFIGNTSGSFGNGGLEAARGVEIFNSGIQQTQGFIGHRDYTNQQRNQTFQSQNVLDKLEAYKKKHSQLKPSVDNATKSRNIAGARHQPYSFSSYSAHSNPGTLKKPGVRLTKNVSGLNQQQTTPLKKKIKTPLTEDVGNKKPQQQSQSKKST
ncbi:hypothetical protein BB559_001868 [Furculomyces boomerangus]|uniref:Suppressor of forked domain-containing protein n=1 Tax=Furculomyces boomerangus TaxID=61424 RepID=A0A2T9Z058_9FUNG|nr:hypothetical protein BB559_001868 [Furculomyces boomerangus]